VQAPADAVEERQAQLALEIPELARQRGLGDVELAAARETLPASATVTK